MPYVDGFILCVKTDKLKEYARIAKTAGKIWREHGALDYKECVADDMNVHCGIPFTKLVKPKADETVIFSWIVFKNKAHRNSVNAKVMKDPRMDAFANVPMPFDHKKMVYGGFKVLVDA